jgi:predicted protein tyrosine phosphatase
MSTFNRLNVALNPYQRHYKKVLCLCSAGCLRSPTAAVVLSQEPFNFNTRAAGVDTDHAIIPVDEVLIAWADEIVCMEKRHERVLRSMFKPEDLASTDIFVLDIPDNFAYRDPRLIAWINTKYKEVTGFGKDSEPKGEIVPEKA